MVAQARNLKRRSVGHQRSYLHVIKSASKRGQLGAGKRLRQDEKARAAINRIRAPVNAWAE